MHSSKKILWNSHASIIMIMIMVMMMMVIVIIIIITNTTILKQFKGVFNTSWKIKKIKVAIYNECNLKIATELRRETVKWHVVYWMQSKNKHNLAQVMEIWKTVRPSWYFQPKIEWKTRLSSSLAKKGEIVGHKYNCHITSIRMGICMWPHAYIFNSCTLQKYSWMHTFNKPL